MRISKKLSSVVIGCRKSHYSAKLWGSTSGAVGTLKRSPSPRKGIVVSIYPKGIEFCRGKQAEGTQGLLLPTRRLTDLTTPGPITLTGTGYCRGLINTNWFLPT